MLLSLCYTIYTSKQPRNEGSLSGPVVHNVPLSNRNTNQRKLKRCHVRWFTAASHTRTPPSSPDQQGVLCCRLVNEHLHTLRRVRTDRGQLGCQSLLISRWSWRGNRGPVAGVPGWASSHSLALYSLSIQTKAVATAQQLERKGGRKGKSSEESKT